MAQALTPAWLSGAPSATALLPRDFADVARRRAHVEAASRRPLARPIGAALAAQEAGRPQSPSRMRSLEALTEGGAACVVTGQQVGLFLGPLYTLHKAAAAVADARALAAESGRPVVPVFWLQTEDADFEEIRRVKLPGGAGEPEVIAISDALGPAGARTSVAHRPLGDGVEPALDQLADLLRGAQHGAEVVDLLARHYRPEATFGDAFAGVMAELFADAGLLLLDPRDPALASFSAPLHRVALTRAAAIAAALTERASALERADFRVQVPIRPGTSLSCFHLGGVDGPRYRLVALEDGLWEVAGAGQTVTTEALLTALDDDARRFSTTALLRPVLQDSWLPTAGYIGGPGELAYFAELPPLYAAFDQRMPMAIPRARFRILGPTDARLAEQLGLAPEDAARPRDALLATLASGAAAAGFDAARAERDALESVDAALAALVAAGAPLDRGLPKATGKAGRAIRDILGRAFERYRRAFAASDTVTAARLARFQGLLAPGGAPQERVYGFPFFAAQHGPKALVDALIDAARPFHPELVDVRP